MHKVFILNPKLNESDFKDTIDQKLTQLRSIVSCLMIANAEISEVNRYGVIWSIDSLLDDLDCLCENIK